MFSRYDYNVFSISFDQDSGKLSATAREIYEAARNGIKVVINLPLNEIDFSGESTAICGEAVFYQIFVSSSGIVFVFGIPGNDKAFVCDTLDEYPVLSE